ncbi:dihydroorotase [Lactobacillus sp. DCY120]|uniref:Dihydroorotase n=1 Tax=Bombilactobacillus apium TaxID=2675299 RepID=A0A850QYD7_9LACO|nr:dihydroorotase [Bombilactobacillus apium]NVY95729.1 dihydroorotase [Bombilactobacillus apium]
MAMIIKAPQVLIKGQFQPAEILIKAGKIAQIAPQIAGGSKPVVEFSDKVIVPGLVDVHVHLREPGLTDKETIHTGSLAAAHGGYTTIAAMPNVDPVPDTPERIAQMQELNQRTGVVHILQYASITKRRQGHELGDYPQLKAAGAFGLSDDGSGIQSAQVMYQAMQAAAQAGLPLMAHVEDHSLLNQGVMNAGPMAQRLHLPGIPEVSETAQLARDLELAAATGVHYHACHLSTARSVELVREAKRRGVAVSAEVTPHHLLLDDSMITDDNPLWKMNPPLRTLADRQSLLGGLFDGTIDMIATDHAPHTARDKGDSMINSAFGITGLETSFALLYTHLVQPGICSLEQLIQWMSTNPAQVFNLTDAGQIAVGQPADLTVLDLQKTTTIKVSEMKSKGKNTPFANVPVHGQVVRTMVAGRWVDLEEE